MAAAQVSVFRLGCEWFQHFNIHCLDVGKTLGRIVNDHPDMSGLRGHLGIVGQDTVPIKLHREFVGILTCAFIFKITNLVGAGHNL